MASKILAFLLTFTVDAVTGIAILVIMLMAMNGYSESDAWWGLIVYIALTVPVSVGTSFLAAVSVTKLILRQFSPLVALLISIPVFSVLGVVLEIGCSLIGIGIAEFVRVRH